MTTPKNPHGDLVVTDPEVLRTLAEPMRYALLTRLQRHGSATAIELAAVIDADESVTREHLEVLAGHGLVRSTGASEDGQDTWDAVATGLLIDVPDDAEGQAAARLLTTQMFLEAAAMPAPWWTDDEPRLPLDWRRVAGLINAGLWMTPDELQTLNDTIEELTAPYANRTEADRPQGARRVRIQCYLMPQPD
jgi:DNA-binding transcriptional ArsR family regulator